MAADFWSSTHCNRWLRPKGEAGDLGNDECRKKDLSVFTEAELKRLRIYYAVYIQNMARSLSDKSTSLPRVRQRVIATAIVYFKRFYHKNSFMDFHPHLVALTCLFLASKVEECPLPPKLIMQQLDSRFPYGIPDLLECEYYVMEELDCNLVVFHPYRAVIQYAADADLGKHLQTVWHLLNDSYRTDVALFYPPHLVGIACIYLAGEYHGVSMIDWLKDIAITKESIDEIVAQIIDMYETYSPADSEFESLACKIPTHTAGSR